MSDPRIPDPRHIDPTMPQSPYRDPAADPRLSDAPPVRPGSGRGGLIAAGIVAALLVVALIAFTSGTTTDPGTTAVIPDQTQQTAPAPGVVPAEPATPPAENPATEPPAGNPSTVQ